MHGPYNIHCHIGQVSEMFHLPISTLRYYDKEGLFPSLKRKGNIRYFSDTEIEVLRVIECLKESGLEIKDIKQFFQWVTEGASSYPNRKQLFEARKAVFLKIIERLQFLVVRIFVLSFVVEWLYQNRTR